MIMKSCAHPGRLSSLLVRPHLGVVDLPPRLQISEGVFAPLQPIGVRRFWLEPQIEGRLLSGGEILRYVRTRIVRYY
jgi:hypothetical protein